MRYSIHTGLLSAFIALTVFSACDEDSFSQVATIELPEHDPLPVVKLQIEAETDRTLSVLVSNSKGILDPDGSYQVPSDAEVNLLRNGSLILPFVFNEERQTYVGDTNAPFPDVAGDVYRLEADIPGFDPVRVEQTMPVKPFIAAATYEEEGTIDESGSRVDELIVDIIDQAPGVTNYYALDLFQVQLVTDPVTGDTTSYFRSRVSIATTDPLLSYGERYSLIFTDEGFSANRYRARCYTYYWLEPDTDLEVVLYQLSEDDFLYSRSLNQYYNALDNPFAEPVTVHSNVPGGFGVFTVSNRTSYFLER